MGHSSGIIFAICFLPYCWAASRRLVSLVVAQPLSWKDENLVRSISSGDQAVPSLQESCFQDICATHESWRLCGDDWGPSNFQVPSKACSKRCFISTTISLETFSADQTPHLDLFFVFLGKKWGCCFAFSGAFQQSILDHFWNIFTGGYYW